MFVIKLFSGSRGSTMLQRKTNKNRLRQQRAGGSRTQDVCFCVVLLAAFLFSLRKCRFGFSGYDEAFYLTIPLRFLQGDAMMADEQHLSQMSGLLLIPFQALFKSGFFGRTGMVLAARYSYTVLHTAVATVLYSRVRRFGPASIAAVLTTYLFAPLNIMAYSYNSMGVDFLELSGVFWATAGKSKIPLLLSGLTLACAVLCCPYLTPLYFAFCIAAFLLRKKSDLFNVKRAVWITVGILPMAAVFFTFLLSRTDIRRIPEYWALMKADPEYFITPFYQRLWETLAGITYPYGKIISAVILCLFVAAVIVCLRDNSRHDHKSIYFCICSLLALLMDISARCHPAGEYSAYYLFPLFMVGFISYIMTEDKSKVKGIFYGVFISGVVYEIAICLTSDQRFFAMSMASVVVCFASVLLAGNLLSEAGFRWSVKAVFGVLLSVMMVLLVADKATHNFETRSSLNPKKQYLIQNGPLKGLYSTSSAFKTEVDSISTDLQYYDTKTPGNLLVLSNYPWPYLQLPEFPIATYSAWVSDTPTHDRLKTYFETNPDKIPKYVYYPKRTRDPEEQDALTEFAIKNGYEIEENAISIKLEKRRGNEAHGGSFKR